MCVDLFNTIALFNINFLLFFLKYHHSTAAIFRQKSHVEDRMFINDLWVYKEGRVEAIYNETLCRLAHARHQSGKYNEDAREKSQLP